MDGAKEGDATVAETPPSMASTTTWTGLAWCFLGSILFIAGSLGFLLSITTYVESWLWSFQFGALCWIFGSLAYLAQLISAVADKLWTREKDKKTECDETPRHPWWLGPTGNALCLLAFVVGCSLVYFGPDGVADQAQVVRYLPAMNGLFTVGSAILFVNPLYLVLISRQWHVFGSCSKSCRRRDAAGTPVAVAPVDWWFDVVVAATFTYAGAAGGYGTDQGAITSGMVFWLIGSLVLLVQALHMLATKLSGGDSEMNVNSKVGIDDGGSVREPPSKEGGRDCPV